MQNSEAISNTGFSLMPVIWIVIIVGLATLAVFLYRGYRKRKEEEKEQKRIEEELRRRRERAVAERKEAEKRAEDERRAMEAQRSKLLEELCGYCQELDRLEQEHDEGSVSVFRKYGRLLQALFSDERVFACGKTGLAEALEQTAVNYGMRKLIDRPAFTPSERKEPRSTEELEGIYGQESLNLLQRVHKEKKLRLQKAFSTPHYRTCMEASGKALEVLWKAICAHDDSACREALATLHGILEKYGLMICFDGHPLTQDPDVRADCFCEVNPGEQLLPALVFRREQGKISPVGDCLGTTSKEV